MKNKFLLGIVTGLICATVLGCASIWRMGTKPLKAQAAVLPIPRDFILFTVSAACPNGWAEYTSLRGRYVVGLPAGGSNLATVGTALTNTENRSAGQHTHSVPVGNGGSGNAIPAGQPIDANTTPTTTGGVTGGVDGTNAP